MCRKQRAAEECRISCRRSLHRAVRNGARSRSGRPFRRRQRPRLDFCARGSTFRQRCSALRTSAASEGSLKRALRRAFPRGSGKRTRRCSADTPLLRRSTKTTSQAARDISTASFQSMKTQRFRSTVCCGTMKNRSTKSPRFCTARRQASRCCSLPILTAWHMCPTHRPLSPTTAEIPVNGIRRWMRRAMTAR